MSVFDRLAARATTTDGPTVVARRPAPFEPARAAPGRPSTSAARTRTDDAPPDGSTSLVDVTVPPGPLAPDSGTPARHDHAAADAVPGTVRPRTGDGDGARGRVASGTGPEPLTRRPTSGPSSGGPAPAPGSASSGPPWPGSPSGPDRRITRLGVRGRGPGSAYLDAAVPVAPGDGAAPDRSSPAPTSDPAPFLGPHRPGRTDRQDPGLGVRAVRGRAAEHPATHRPVAREDGDDASGVPASLRHASAAVPVPTGSWAAPRTAGPDPAVTTGPAASGPAGAAVPSARNRTVSTTDLLARLAPALERTGAAGAAEADRLRDRSAQPLAVTGLDPVEVPVTADVHLHVGRVEIHHPPGQVPPAPPVARARVDHAAYLARQKDRWRR
ncbi:hypothetical protein IF650_18965 [Cellulosimicrobium terreum]|nr:hypothetical protein [Cellulosimicrobium terreum]